MSKPRQPDDAKDQKRDEAPESDEDKPGTNAVQHHPDPRAQRLPEGEQHYHPRSPYTTGNY
jgi:hypothetical protein